MTGSRHKVNTNAVYSTFKIMIEHSRKREVFEVNYTNLNDLPTHGGSKVVKQPTLILPAICQRIKNASEVKRKKSWVECNHKKVQRIKITQATYAKTTILTSNKRLNNIMNLGDNNNRQRSYGLFHTRWHKQNKCDKISDY